MRGIDFRSLILVVAFLFCSSCWNSSVEQPVVQSHNVRKQKQKVLLLQKKLELAQKERKKVDDEMEQIATELDKVQLSLIHKQINDYEKKGSKIPEQFLEEREALYRMIQNGPSPSAFEAQVELDRILRLITERSDGEKSA